MMSFAKALTLALLLPGLAACANDRMGGDPPGTAVSRAWDRTVGTNTSGAYPTQSDGTRINPPGTEATRALDRAAQTNVSGAYPSQADGTAVNPRGTAAGRAIDRALDTEDTRPRPLPPRL